MDRNRDFNRRRSRSRSPLPRGGPGSFDRFGRNSRDGYGRDREISGRDVGRDRNQGNFNKDFVGGRDRDRDRDWGRRDRSRSRERDRDRGGYRERSRDNKDQYRDRGDYRNHDGMSAEVYDACRDPTCTIIVKGLAPRTTEPTLFHLLQPYSPKDIRLITTRDTGECKGYAFIEFYSVEYSKYFHDSFAGSTGKGDANAPQFIVDNRAVSMGYVPDGHVNDWQRKNDGHNDISASKVCDWICNVCKCQNFSRREICFKCYNPKNEHCINLNSDPYNESIISSSEPSTILVAKGLNILSTEQDVQEVFRPYALVKSVTLVRDPVTQMSKGIALVEFNSIQFATHTLNAAQNLLFEGRPLKVFFAKRSFVEDTRSFAQQHALQVKYAAAIQAAQWSQHQMTDHNSGVPSAYQAAVAAHQNRLSTASASAVAHTPGTSQAKSPWPPCFETQGGSYLFQPNSGMFLESATNFYYCPKSKLYYNGNDGAYYKYDSSLSTPFVLFQPPLPTVDKNVADEVLTTSETKPTEKEKKPVSMSLGNEQRRAKVAKMFSAAMEEEDPVIVNTAPTQHIPSKGRAMNDAERKVAEANAIPKSLAAHRRATMLPKHSKPSGPQDIDRPNADSFHPGISTVQTTLTPAVAATAAANVPVNKIACLLCRRAFSSHEMLARHERESQLHAENLAKLALSQAQDEEIGAKASGSDSSASSAGATSRPTTADIVSGTFVGSSGAVYKDRAAERRAQSGVGVGPADPSMMKRRSESERDDRWRKPGYDANKFARVDAPLPPGMSAEQAAKVYEDEDNVGNVMLRKMGWEENRGLGKDGSGIHNPVSLEGSKIGNDKSGVGTIDQSIPPVVYSTSGQEYKESLLRATQARFEHVQKTEERKNGR